jgi:hypothetical protein
MYSNNYSSKKSQQTQQLLSSVEDRKDINWINVIANLQTILIREEIGEDATWFEVIISSPHTSLFYLCCSICEVLINCMIMMNLFHYYPDRSLLVHIDDHHLTQLNQLMDIYKDRVDCLY